MKLWYMLIASYPSSEHVREVVADEPIGGQMILFSFYFISPALTKVCLKSSVARGKTISLRLLAKMITKDPVFISGSREDTAL